MAKKKDAAASHLEFMRLAVKLSEKNLDTRNGGPFGAVIVKNGKVVAQECNTVTCTHDPTAHAEVNAIRAACKKLGSPDLEGYVMYTSCEPCPMCTSAIYWARISKVYYGNTKADAAWAGFGDAFITEQLQKPLEEQSVYFERLGGSEALVAFEKWKALTALEQEEVKDGSL